MASGIDVLSREVFNQAQHLRATVEQCGILPAVGSQLQDVESCLKIWAQNIGALRTDTFSLTHRVREAPKLEAWFRTRLADLQEDLDDGK